MNDDLNQNKPLKSELVQLLTQSFQTNLNLIAYMEQTGVVLDQQDWLHMLKSPQNSELPSTISHTKTERMEGKNQSTTKKNSSSMERLSEVKKLISKHRAELKTIKTEVREYEQIAGRAGQNLINEEADLEDFTTRIAGIEANLSKLQTFEETHLDSRK
jgi:septal ring factor EnvC (AmiA/AmiB activator)